MATRARILALRVATKDQWFFHTRAVKEVSATRASEVASRLAASSAGPEDYLPDSAVVWGKKTVRGITDMWERWGASPEGGWRRRAHAAGTWALERIHPEETTLSELPAVVTSSAEVVYPAGAAAEEVRELRRRLRELAGSGADAARRRMWWNVAVCPLFLPLMLTPVSNFPIYWFLWRAWNNRRSAQGGYALRQLLDAHDQAEPGGGLEHEERREWRRGEEGDGRGVGGGGGGGENNVDVEREGTASASAAWVDYTKECTRRAGVLGGTAGDEADDDDTVCCRVRSSSAAVGSSSLDPPAVLFVPCALLDAADSRLLRRVGEEAGVVEGEEGAEDSFDPEAVKDVENLMGARGVTELARRYHHRLASSPK